MSWYVVTSHANFCDDSITAKGDSDITKSTGTTTTILQTSNQPPAEVIGVTFFTPAPVPKNVTPDPAPELIGNLHSDSCLHSKSLKVEFILLHDVK